MAALYAKEGKGISNSNHTKRLAVDLNIFKDGKLLITFDEYLEIGQQWESINESSCPYTASWGGRFKSVDLGHFSFEDNGIK